MKHLPALPSPTLAIRACLLTGLIGFFSQTPTRAQNIAEDLLVAIDATSYPSNGVLNVITNAGSMGGVFVANGGAVTTPEVIEIGGTNGTRAIRFDGLDFMQHFDTQGGSLMLAHPGIVGSNRTVTIEAWVINNTLGTEETIVAWGRRGGPVGANSSFNYGSSPDHGAMTQWGTFDIGWGPTVPAAGLWHHLAYTFDGATSKVYIDGVLTTTEALPINSINTHTNTPITLAAQLNADTTVEGSVRGSLAIGRLRIHDGVLSDLELMQNYDAEKAAFTKGTPSPLSAGPIHRYSFDHAGGTATNSTIIPDRVGTADAIVYGDNGFFVDGVLSLPGGSYTNAAFVDLPNRIFSTNSLNNGGTGQITIEGWHLMTGNGRWGRMFDFGSGTAGEITGTGTASTGLDYFLLTAQFGNDVTLKRLEIRNQEPVNTGSEPLDFESFTPPGTPYHYAVTWDEATGDIRVYENGVETAGYTVNHVFSDINDINNWIARGQWSNDAVLKTDVDEFRIYDYVLAPEQVAINAIYGPDVVFVEPGALQAIRLTTTFTNLFPQSEQAIALFADYQNVTNLEVAAMNVSYTTSPTGIIDVTTNGFIQTLATGSTTLSAVFGGLTNSLAINVVEPSATLLHRYEFTSDASDSVGTAHGTLMNGASANGQLTLDAALDQYVNLPAGIISPTYALTVEAFVDFGVNGTFARLFDFGRQDDALQGVDYVFFSPTGSGNVSWMEMRGNTLAKDALNVAPNLNEHTNTHVVTVFHPAGDRLSLYLDGCLVAERNNITATAMNEVVDELNWIGRSLYSNDAYLNADIDELRIYDGIVSAKQVAYSQAAGADVLAPADPGALQAIRAIGSPSMILDQTKTLEVFGDFALVTNVNLCAFDLVYTSNDEQIATVSTNGVITALREGSTDIIVRLNGISTNFPITAMRLGTLDLAHRYPFDGNVDDVIGGAHGVLSNNTATATFINGQLVLGNDGTQGSGTLTGDYVDLPNGMISALTTNATFEIWSTWNDNANRLWQRIFDFGSSNGGENISNSGTAGHYILITPNGSPGVNIFAYQTQNPNRNERRLQDTVASTPGSETHYVISWNGLDQSVRMYINGALVSTGDLHMQLSGIIDFNNWLGRSQFGNDSYFVGSYNEFRIYEGAMASTDVLASYLAGPDALDATPNPILNIQRIGNMLRIAWPIESTGGILQSADSAHGPFTNTGLAVTVEGQEHTAYDSAVGNRKVYRLVR